MPSYLLSAGIQTCPVIKHIQKETPTLKKKANEKETHCLRRLPYAILIFGAWYYFGYNLMLTVIHKTITNNKLF